MFSWTLLGFFVIIFFIAEVCKLAKRGSQPPHKPAPKSRPLTLARAIEYQAKRRAMRWAFKKVRFRR
jgi:hypothetical protein